MQPVGLATCAAAPAVGRSAGAAGAARDRQFELRLQSGRVPRDPAEKLEFLRYLSRMLESSVIQSVFRTARASEPEDGLFSGGFAGGMYRDMADEEFSRLLALRGGFGLSEVLFRQLAAREAAAAYQKAAAADLDPKGAPQGSDNRIGGRECPRA